MKLTEEQIEKIRNQSYKTQETLENLNKEFAKLAESFGLKEDTQCTKECSAWNWLYDAVWNFPPVSLHNTESFETCIKLLNRRLEEIENEKV